MAYFDHHPDIVLPSFSPDRNSSNDATVVKNLFKRGKIREKYFENAMSFEKYNIQGDDRPDNVAYDIYKDSSLDWVVLISNNIINIRDEWPMSQYDFQRFIDNKYSAEQVTQVHHYETKEIRDTDGILLLDAGNRVDANFSFEYSYFGTNYSLSGSDVITSFTNYDYEVSVNEKKRNIFVLRKEYLDMLMSDMKDIMSYKDSSQYISKKLKTGDNIRNT